MRIALIADVHANLPALESVLADAKKRRAAELWNLGDFLGYGPYPEDVAERLRRERALSIIGNYDLKVLEFKEKESGWKKDKARDKFFSFAWTYAHISEGTRDYLGGLPAELSLEREGLRFLLVHGSPESIDEPLSPDTTDERLLELSKRVSADAVLCAHSHQPFDREAGGVRFINPGSVGRPFDGSPSASYAILEIQVNKIESIPVRVSYSTEKLARDMEKDGFPERMVQSILLARSLDDLEGAEGDPEEEPERESYAASLLEAALALAESCLYEKEHSHQVTRLSLRLFDELKSLTGLGEKERLLLEAGALLHDIGWIEGALRHNKVARDKIFAAKELPLKNRERTIIALLARYHRGGLPKDSHKQYSGLDRSGRETVEKLASLLRIADGLDRTHRNSVEDLNCRIEPESVILEIKGEPSQVDLMNGKQKADLFEKVFGRELVIDCRQEL